MRYLLVLIILALTGCATNPTNTVVLNFNEDQRFTTPAGVMGRRIVWVAMSHEDLQKKCLALTGHRTGAFKMFLGCATYDQVSCTVYTGTDTNHQLLGHEVRHCFHGNFHK
jgi:hypothetical protein